MTHDVLIHAEEFCLGDPTPNRPRPGGAAGIVEIRSNDAWERSDFWISEPDATDHQMALTSAIIPLELLEAARSIRFVSGSRYLVDGATNRLDAWIAEGWQGKDGTIENLALWKHLSRAIEPHDVTWALFGDDADDARRDYVRDLAVRAAQNLHTSDGLVESGFMAWLEEQGRRFDRTDLMEPAADV